MTVEPADSHNLGTSLFSERGLDPSRASTQQHAAAHAAVEIARTTLTLTHHHMEALESIPTWGLVYAALGRVQEYAEGAIAASVVSPVAAEIVARTVVEGSVNVRYILSGNIPARLYAYFSHYLQTEESQNAKWSQLVKMLPEGDEAHQNLAGLEQKTRALALQREAVRTVFADIGVNTHSPETWGTTFARFESLGEALEYRTIYAALCSQAHNDAEDLLNTFTLFATGNETRVESLQAETAAFSWFAVTLGLRQYARAATDYWTTYSVLKGHPQAVDVLLTSVDQLASEAAQRVRGK